MAKKFIVAVVGTANTGKTTFKNDLIRSFSSDPEFDPFTTNEVDYREKILKEGLKINREGNLRSQKIIFDCLADSLVQAVKDPSVTNFISDRSVIDAYVYTEYLKEHNPDSGITEKDLAAMRSSMIAFSKMYDRIIYFPLSECSDIKVVDDKFRDTDYWFRLQIDRIFNSTLTLLECIGACHSVRDITGSRKERVSKFRERFGCFWLSTKDEDNGGELT